MPVLGLNHINIRTPDFTRTVAFLRDALGMKVSPVPQFDSIDKAAWVYDDSGWPVLHLASADVPYSSTEVLPAPPPRGSGAIHHVALSCVDFEAMRSRLTALEFTFREGHNIDTGVRQIFVRDPTNILLELNFNEGKKDG
jgi:catechol 2,3-dioxygenase-like lactoylglutathione lyase family enzyme